MSRQQQTYSCGEIGSAQPDHVDSLYMTPRSPHHLVAIWVALEDTHPDAGPLRYYPGSHKIPQYVFSNGSHHFIQDEMPLWDRHMRAQVEALKLQPEVFLARKGDVFVWSAYLLHGGSDIRDPARTRKSVVSIHRRPLSERRYMRSKTVETAAIASRPAHHQFLNRSLIMIRMRVGVGSV